MAFSTQREFFPLEFYSSSNSQSDTAKKLSLKSYESCTDVRACSIDSQERTKYLTDLLYKCEEESNETMSSLGSEDKLELENFEKEINDLKLKGELTPEWENKLLKRGLKRYNFLKRDNKLLRKQIKMLQASKDYESSEDLIQHGSVKGVIDDGKSDVSSGKKVLLNLEDCRDEVERYRKVFEQYGDEKKLQLMKQRSDILDEVLKERDMLQNQIDRIVGLEDKIAFMKSRSEEANKLEDETINLKTALNIFAEKHKLLEEKVQDYECIKTDLKEYELQISELNEKLEEAREQILNREFELNNTYEKLNEAGQVVSEYETQCENLTSIIFELKQHQKCECNKLKQEIKMLQDKLESTTTDEPNELHKQHFQKLNEASQMTLAHIRKEFDARSILAEELSQVKSVMSLHKQKSLVFRENQIELLKKTEELLREKEQLEDLLKTKLEAQKSLILNESQVAKLKSRTFELEQYVEDMRNENNILRRTVEDLQKQAEVRLEHVRSVTYTNEQRGEKKTLDQEHDISVEPSDGNNVERPAPDSHDLKLEEVKTSETEVKDVKADGPTIDSESRGNLQIKKEDNVKEDISDVKPPVSMEPVVSKLLVEEMDIPVKTEPMPSTSVSVKISATEIKAEHVDNQEEIEPEPSISESLKQMSVTYVKQKSFKEEIKMPLEQVVTAETPMQNEKKAKLISLTSIITDSERLLDDEEVSIYPLGPDTESYTAENHAEFQEENIHLKAALQECRTDVENLEKEKINFEKIIEQLQIEKETPEDENEFQSDNVEDQSLFGGLKNEVDRLLADRDNLKMENENLKEQLKNALEMQTTLEVHSETEESVQERHKGKEMASQDTVDIPHEDEIVKSQHLPEARQQELEEIEDKYKNLKKQMQVTVDKNENLERELQVLKEVLESKEKERAVLENTKKELQEFLAKMNLELQEIKSQTAKDKQHHDSVVEDLRKLIEDNGRGSDLLKCTQETEDLKELLEKERKATSDRNPVVNEENSGLEASEAEIITDTAIQTLKQEYEKQRTELETCNHKCILLQKDLDFMKLQIEQKKSMVVLLQEEFDNLQKENELHVTRSKTIEGEVLEVKMSNEDLQKQIRDKEEVMQKLKTEIEQKETEKAQLQDEMNNLNEIHWANLQLREAAVEDCLKILKQQEQEINRCSEELTALKKANEVMKVDLETSRVEEKRLTDDLQNKEANLEALSLELQKVKNEATQLQEQFLGSISSLEKENEILKDTLQTMNKNVLDLELLVDELGKEQEKAQELEKSLLQKVKTGAESQVSVAQSSLSGERTEQEEIQRLSDALMKCKLQLDIETNRNNENDVLLKNLRQDIQQLEADKEIIANSLKDAERDLTIARTEIGVLQASRELSQAQQTHPITPEISEETVISTQPSQQANQNSTPVPELITNETTENPEEKLTPRLSSIQVHKESLLKMNGHGETSCAEEIRQTFENKLKYKEAIHEAGVQKLQSLHEIQLHDLIKIHNREIKSLRMTNEAMRESIMNIKTLLSTKVDGKLTEDDAKKIENKIEEIRTMTCKCGTIGSTTSRVIESKLQEMCIKILDLGLDKLSLQDLAYLHREIYKAGARLVSMEKSSPYSKGQVSLVFPSTRIDLERKFNSLQKEFDNANVVLQHLKKVHDGHVFEAKGNCIRLSGGYAPCPCKEEMNTIQRQVAQVKPEKFKVPTKFNNSRSARK